MQKPNIEVCLSPQLFDLYDIKGKVVVVIDILRASSTIVTALNNGAEKVIPVSSLEDCQAYRHEANHILAAERNGQVADGFEHGNSPLEYTKETIEGKTLVLTTSNGTKCLNMSHNADLVLVGSFLNLSSVCNKLFETHKDCILFCAGWKGHFNIEDTLFAGAVIEKLHYHFNFNNDAAFAARQLFVNAEEHLLDVISHSNHYQRLASYGVLEDIEYCMQQDLFHSVPELKGNFLVLD